MRAQIFRHQIAMLIAKLQFVPVRVRIPTQAGRGYRFEAGHHSEMKPAT